MSELIGKETIDTNTYGRSYGTHGNYTTNMQNTGRELMTPDEVRMLDNKFALLFIRGERPIKDLKYDLLKHPNIKHTTDGGKEVYRHGEVRNDIASIVFDFFDAGGIIEIELPEGNFVLLSEEDVLGGEDDSEKK